MLSGPLASPSLLLALNRQHLPSRPRYNRSTLVFRDASSLCRISADWIWPFHLGHSCYAVHLGVLAFLRSSRSPRPQPEELITRVHAAMVAPSSVSRAQLARIILRVSTGGVELFSPCPPRSSLFFYVWIVSFPSFWPDPKRAGVPLGRFVVLFPSVMRPRTPPSAIAENSSYPLVTPRGTWFTTPTWASALTKP